MDPQRKYNIYDTRSESFPTIQFGQATRTVGDTTNSFLLKAVAEEGKSILVSTPVSKFKPTSKKGICELSLPTHESEFYDWIEKIEAICVDYLFQNQKKWFQTDLLLEDVENLFVSPFKIYKSAKIYTIRSHLGSSFRVFNQDKSEVSASDTLLTELPVTGTIEIVGIRCTSKNFQLELVLRDVTLHNEKVNPLEVKLEEVKEVNPLEVKLEEVKEVNKEVVVPLEEILVDDADAAFVKVKPSAEVYQQIYERALNKGLMARDLGVLNYLESKNIQNTQLLLG
jgi:hypothetical protein